MAAEIATGLGAVARAYKRILITAGVAGVIAVAVSIPLGHWVAGVTFIGGLLLGWINTMMTVASAGKYAEKAGSPEAESPAKGPIVVSTLKRLAAFTAIALVVAFLLRPDGVAIIFGLMFFHMLMVGTTSRGLVAELRRQEP